MTGHSTHETGRANGVQFPRPAPSHNEALSLPDIFLAMNAWRLLSA